MAKRLESVCRSIFLYRGSGYVEVGVRGVKTHRAFEYKDKETKRKGYLCEMDNGRRKEQKIVDAS